MSLRARLAPRWQLLRVRRPAAAGRVEDAVRGARGRDALLAEVRGLRSRLAELERDHLLLAAHVATLGPQAGGVGTDDDALQRARVAAIAGYEQRLGDLEAGLDEVRRARRRSSRVSDSGTSDERGARTP